MLPEESNGQQRWALAIEYDGAAYHGWQAQHSPQLATIQGALEGALSSVANVPIQVICAGRTDAGVHALAQVIHFDTAANRTELEWVLGANRYLPPAIRVLWAVPVTESFHARYAATARRYQYNINSHPVRPALLRNHVTWHRKPLNLKHMKKAAKYLVGEHDFNAYRSSDCQAKSPVRKITHLKLTQKNDTICLDIQANAFLHHMVRNIVGVLMKIGMGECDPKWAKEVLESRDRKKGGVTAPAAGLYLYSVSYPKVHNLPKILPVFY